MLRTAKGIVLHPGMVVIGAILAILLTFVNPHFYHLLTETPFYQLPNWLGSKPVTLHFVTNEVLMCFFFVLAAKEVREALLPEGSLHGIRTAILPLLATTGGVVGPIVVFLGLATAFMPSIRHGFVVPTATDIVFAAMAAGLVFTTKHPAKTFLLTIAVVDDGIGLVLIPVFYSKGVNWLAFAALILAEILLAYAFRKAGIRRWWWYVLLLGVPSWMGFVHLGVEPAMALVPLVACMPHALTDDGWWDENELKRPDSLSRMERALEPWTGMILFMFGLANCGIALTSGWGMATWIVAISLIVGKFCGIAAFTWTGLQLGLKLPQGMTWHNVQLVAIMAGVGFTVSIFVAGIAFEGSVATAAKIGALLSLGCIPLAYAVAKRQQQQAV